MLRNWLLKTVERGVASARRRPGAAQRAPRARRVAVEPLEQRCLLDAGPLITELMAVNDGGLLDEDGDDSDWIEIHNPTASPVELDGWYLTDDDDELTKWQFPDADPGTAEVSIPSGGYLVVFASDKDRDDPASWLHTNFKLDGGGEYLALVEPDGTTIAHDFAPEYPDQQQNVSYGVAQYLDEQTLLAGGAAARTLVPTDGSVDATWFAEAFDDSSWQTGMTGVGYGVQATSYYDAIRDSAPIAYWRLEQVGDNSAQMLNAASTAAGFPGALGSAVDSSAVNFGGAGSLRGAPGLLAASVNAAARFDGADDHVHIPDHAGLGNSTTTEERTIELWFNADAVPDPSSSDHQVLWEDGGTTNGLNVYLYKGEVYFGAWTSNAGDWISSPVASGTTYHAVMTYNADANQLFGYLNGEPIFEQVVTDLPVIASHSGDNAIGRAKQDTRFEDSSFSGDGVYFDGVLDEVAIYDRALAPSEVATHYQSAFFADAPAQLVGYWPFDETADGGATAPDATGNYDGTIYGATLTTGDGGQSGEAMQFDGDNDYIDLGVVSEMDAADAFTVSVWFRRDYDNRFDYTAHLLNNVLISQSSAAGNDNFELGTETSYVEVYLDTTEQDGPNPSIRENVGISDGTWHHLAMTYDREAAFETRLYVDGVLIDQYDDWGGPLDSSLGAPLTIGMARPDGDANGDFQGLIDEVALWDGALDDDQVAALASGGSPLDAAGFDGLIGTHVQAELQGNGTSTYTRIPFEVDADPAVFDFLTLRMKYDDGFVAYLNGQEVAARNAPAVPGFDSIATAPRPDNERIISEVIDLRAYIPLLNEGTNVLAVHTLNIDVDDDDLLMLPELEAAIDLGTADRFFAVPTPGVPNNESFEGFLEEPEFDVERGFYDEAFWLTLDTDSDDATIRYTTDGNAPTATSGQEYTGPISVDTTTVIRAATFRPGYRTSDVVTSSYIFIDDVIDQPDAPAGFPSVWGPAPADYGMDPDITGDAVYGPQMRDALEALPTISLAINYNDMWDPGIGIYANTLEHGIEWERDVSVEMIGFEYADNEQVNAGIRIQGAASRSTTRPKHNMRLIFRSEYGPGKLEYPLFGDTEVQRFDQVVLRGGNGDAWIHPTAIQRTNSQYIRDQWHRDAQVSMGQPTAGQSYAHLYINGLYWGLYHLIERPDASYMAEHFGGDEEEYDVLRHKNETVDGDRTEWDAMMSLLRNNDVSDPAVYEQALQYIDPVNLADYMALNLYSGNTDWDHNNWYGARKREAGEGWKFFSWDSERTFLSLTQNTFNSLPKTNQPSEVHDRLTANAEYVMQFADQVHKHFFNGGTLTPEVAAALWNARADEIRLPLIAESARFGDHHRPADPYDPDTDWETHLAWLNGTYFPQRSDIVLNQIKAEGLYPSVVAPSFEVNSVPRHGGEITTTDLLTMPAPAGTIYYTLDGTDPRLTGGAINTASAVIFDGTPITLSEPGPIKARVYDGGTWSALNEAVFFVGRPAAPGDLAISELMYHPVDPTAEELLVEPLWTDDDFEFVEIVNTTAEVVSLYGVELTGGVTFDFTSGTTSELAPGERVVVVANQAAFEARYGTGIDVAGEYAEDDDNTDDPLSNGGETIVLKGPDGQRILDFRFDDQRGWPGRADGKGSSLEVIDTAGDFSDDDNWRSSNEYGGSPGTAGTGPVIDIVVNEVLAHTDPPLTASDSIELHNTTGEAIDVGGWYLSDSSDNYLKFRIPLGEPAATTIPAGGYLVFDEDDFNTSGGADPNDFALSAFGDDVWLLEADAGGQLLRFADHVEFRASANGESFGRWPDDAGDLYPMAATTLGADNALSGPRVGPVVISEIMYVPAEAAGDVSTSDLEFVEIHNTSPFAIELAHWYDADGDSIRDPGEVAPWRLDKAVEFDFPLGPDLHGISLPAGGTLVVVRFDPNDADEADTLAAFRARYGIDTSVPLLGGYSGKLDNDGECVRLLRADDPPLDQLDAFAYLLEDEVDYDATWPGSPAVGESIHRVAGDAWGNQADSWLADTPSPGTVSLQPPSVAVVGRHVFYNDSHFDGLDPAANPADDAAIATGKAALLPGQTATFNNYTSYSRGINGIMVDMAGLPSGASLVASDFEFHVGNTDFPSTWDAAPAPLAVGGVTTRPIDLDGNGSPDAHRVTIVWTDNLIENTWLEVTVKATANTGLADSDVFYFGNAIGESGDSAENAMVTSADEIGARHNPQIFTVASIDNVYDYNRDGRVTSVDQILARQNITVFDAIDLITVPPVAAPPPALPARVAWLFDFEDYSDNLTSDDAEPDKNAVDQLLATLDQ